jgi:hypothetical protein
VLLRPPSRQFLPGNRGADDRLGHVLQLAEGLLDLLIAVEIVLTGVGPDLGGGNETSTRQMVDADELIRHAVAEIAQVKPRDEVVPFVFGHVGIPLGKASGTAASPVSLYLLECRRRDLNPHAPRGTRV